MYPSNQTPQLPVPQGPFQVKGTDPNDIVAVLGMLLILFGAGSYFFALEILAALTGAKSGEELALRLFFDRDLQKGFELLRTGGGAACLIGVLIFLAAIATRRRMT